MSDCGSWSRMAATMTLDSVHPVGTDAGAVAVMMRWPAPPLPTTVASGIPPRLPGDATSVARSLADRRSGRLILENALRSVNCCPVAYACHVAVHSGPAYLYTFCSHENALRVSVCSEVRGLDGMTCRRT